MGKIQKVIIGEGRRFYVKENNDLHTQYGYVKFKQMEKPGKVKTNTGKEFIVFDAGFVDRFRKIKRGAQIITLKDAGVIISEVGLGKESKVVEAGGGSGALTCVLGNICKSVVSYEIRKEHVTIIKENVANFELKNVKIKNKDVTKGITERKLDMVFLDMPDPERVIEHALKAIKSGGFLVAYMPSITQVVNYVAAIRKSKFLLEKVNETIQREWKIEGKIARPEFRMLGHTGFLVFSRKIK